MERRLHKGPLRLADARALLLFLPGALLLRTPDQFIKQRGHDLPVALRDAPLDKGTEQVQRNGQHDRRVLLRGDLGHGLEKSELDGRRAIQFVGGLTKPLGRLVLALGGDDLGPPLAFALGLPGHRPLHLLGYLDVLDLDNAHLYAPGFGLLVYDGLKLGVYDLTVGEQIVEVFLAKDAPQGGLGNLGGRLHEVLDLDDALVGIHNPEVDNGGHASRHVVAGYDVLGRHVHRDRSQVHLDHPVHERDEEEEPRPFGAAAINPPEAEHDPPLVLLEDLDGAGQQEQSDNNDYGHDHDDRHHTDPKSP